MNQHPHQREEKEYDQNDGDPLKQAGFGLGELVAADGTTSAAFGHVHCAVGALFFTVSHQFETLLRSVFLLSVVSTRLPL